MAIRSLAVDKNQVCGAELQAALVIPNNEARATAGHPQNGLSLGQIALADVLSGRAASTFWNPPITSNSGDFEDEAVTRHHESPYHTNGRLLLVEQVVDTVIAMLDEDDLTLSWPDEDEGTEHITGSKPHINIMEGQ